MGDLALLLDDLVTANKILAYHHVVDSFGHVSIRNPDDPNSFFMSRARAPNCVEIGDITQFSLQGEIIGRNPGKPYSERFIHGSIYEARPDVMAVVHNHSPNIVPFTVQTKKRLRPIMHMCAPIGDDIPTWDISHKFGVTNLLVTSMDVGRDLAKTLGPTRRVALMRGHGSVVVGQGLREAVFTSVYFEINADMLIKAYQLGDGEVIPLSEGEIEANTKGRAGFTLERGWENWCRLVDRPYYAQAWEMGAGFSRTDQ